MIRKRTEKDIIRVEFEHDGSNFCAYGYPERFMGRNEYDFQDEFESAEVVDLAVYVDYTIEQLILTEEPLPISIDLKLYYKDFYEVIEIAKEKINEKYYDTLD